MITSVLTSIPTSLYLIILTIPIILYFSLRSRGNKPTLPPGKRLPPVVPHSIPFLGNAISFGKDPLTFLQSNRNKYGDVFTFKMVGMNFTYLLGSDACSLFFNSKNEDLNAEEVYQKITTPVFGEGVAYDVPNKVFGEQKRMMKTGLTIARFRNYVGYIEQEVEAYTSKWESESDTDIFVAMSQLIILTASRCLHGKEIRAKLDEGVAQLYLDLDGGFSQLAWLLPAWTPMPSFRKRDIAHRKMKKIFRAVIASRRASPDPEQEDDFLHVLLHSQYRSGRGLSDEEIAGMLIAMLMAGQHTSSTTSAWLLLFLARDKSLQARVYQEQLEVCGHDLSPLSYEDIKSLDLLDRCIRETLRLRPPLMTLMRMCKVQQVVGEYCVPVGHQICVSPTINQQSGDVWSPPVSGFDPDRYLDPSEGQGSSGCPADVASPESESQEKFNYIPFGAGRHRCVGEPFAYVQIKTVISYLIRRYEFDLIDGRFPPINYATMIHTPKDPIIRYKRR